MILKKILTISVLFLTFGPFSIQATAAPEISGQQATVGTNEQLPTPDTTGPGCNWLTATPWRLEEMAGENVLGEQSAPYLFFTNAGELYGFGGCNYFCGKYRFDEGKKIVISSLRAFHEKCPESSKQETSLLTSLVLANTVQVDKTALSFQLDDTPLMKLGPAPEISGEELVQQTKILKIHKKGRKGRGKKKRSKSKSPKPSKAAAAGAITAPPSKPAALKTKDVRPNSTPYNQKHKGKT